jgi:competence protein ComGC
MRKRLEVKRANYGFTRVEVAIFLTVVAVVSMIMALVVSSVAYGDGDVQTTDVTKEMSVTIQDHMDAYGLERLSAPEIRHIVAQRHDFNFDEVVHQGERQSLWFHLPTRQFIMTDLIDNMTADDMRDMANALGREPFLFQAVRTRSYPTSGKQLEELVEHFILISTNGSELERAIHQIRNLRYERDYYQLIDVPDSLFSRYGLDTHISQFAFEQTIYVNDFSSLTKAYRTGRLEHIIFSDHIRTIDSDTFESVKSIMPETLRLPSSIQVIEQGSFSDMPNRLLLTYDDLDSIRVEKGAFDPEDRLNDALRQKESEDRLMTIAISYNAAEYEMRYYEDDSTDSYLGKKAHYAYNVTDYFDASDTLIGTKVGAFVFDPDGVLVSDGPTVESVSSLESSFALASRIDKAYVNKIELSITDMTYNVHLEEVSEWSYVIHVSMGDIRIEAWAYDLDMMVIGKGMVEIRTRIFQNTLSQNSSG